MIQPLRCNWIVLCKTVQHYFFCRDSSWHFMLLYVCSMFGMIGLKLPANSGGRQDRVYRSSTSFSFCLKMFLSSPRVDSIFSRENWFSPSSDLSLATQELSSVTVLSSRTHSFTSTSHFFTQASETALTLLYLSLRAATSVSASV